MCMTSPSHRCTGDWLWLGKANPVISLSKAALMALREIRNCPSRWDQLHACASLLPDTPPSHFSRCSPTSAPSPPQLWGTGKGKLNKEMDKPRYRPNQTVGTVGEALLNGFKALTKNSLLRDDKKLGGGKQLILSLKWPQTHLLYTVALVCPAEMTMSHQMTAIATPVLQDIFLARHWLTETLTHSPSNLFPSHSSPILFDFLSLLCWWQQKSWVILLKHLHPHFMQCWIVLLHHLWHLKWSCVHCMDWAVQKAHFILQMDIVLSFCSAALQERKGDI